MAVSKNSRIHTVDDARRLARRRLPRLVFDFIEGAAGREVACARNEAAFDGIELQSRVLRDVSIRRTNVSFLGQDFDHPFGIAPMGMCNLVWPNADKMLAASASQFNIPVCLSTAASSTLEDMFRWADDRAWFQLYGSGATDDTWDLVRRAQHSGYDKLILTVDVPQVSKRVRDVRNGFSMPFHIGLRQFFDFAQHPRWSISSLISGVPSPRNFPSPDGSGGFDRNASRAGVNWEFLDQLREMWKGRLIVKGVTSSEDAVAIKKVGVDAIYVSNHGGRQLDSSPSAIGVLPLIRAAVGPEFPLIFDSGIRNGEDVAKALACGADFVMIGRPLLFSIGAEAQVGLYALIRAFAEELSLTMAQLGLTDVAGLTDEVLVRTPFERPATSDSTEPATVTALRT